MNEYVKTEWVDNDAPPLSAANLNHIESGIEAVTNAVIAQNNVEIIHTNTLDSATKMGVVYLAIVMEEVSAVICSNSSTRLTQYAFTPSFLLTRYAPATAGHQSGAWSAWKNQLTIAGT